MREELRSNQCARNSIARSSTYNGRTETQEKGRTEDNTKIPPTKCRRNKNHHTRTIWNWTRRHTKPTSSRAERTRAGRTDDGSSEEKGSSEQHDPSLEQTCRIETQIKQTSKKQPEGTVKSGTMQQQETQQWRELSPTTSGEREETREPYQQTAARGEMQEQQAQRQQIQIEQYKQPEEPDKTERKKHRNHRNRKPGETNIASKTEKKIKKKQRQKEQAEMEQYLNWYFDAQRKTETKRTEEPTTPWPRTCKL